MKEGLATERGVIRFDLHGGRTAVISGGSTFQREHSSSLSMLEAVVVNSGHVGKYISRKVFDLEFCPTKKGIVIKNNDK